MIPCTKEFLMDLADEASTLGICRILICRYWPNAIHHCLSWPRNFASNLFNDVGHRGSGLKQFRSTLWMHLIDFVPPLGRRDIIKFRSIGKMRWLLGSKAHKGLWMRQCDTIAKSIWLVKWQHVSIQMATPILCHNSDFKSFTPLTIQEAGRIVSRC